MRIARPTSPLQWLGATLLWLAAWSLPGLLTTAQLAVGYGLRGDDPELSLLLQISLPGWYAWALITPAVIVLARRMPVGRGGVSALAAHAGANVVVWAAWVALVIGARRGLGLPGGSDLGVVAVNAIGAALLAYWGTAIATSLWIARAEATAREIRTAELDAELSRARLAALSARLQPHFLFNTMNAISADVRSDPSRAERMLVDLADLLRMVLEAPDSEMVPLEREIEFTRRYIELQRVRLAERVTIDLDVIGEIGSVSVPTLLLQPLVENAIEHGVVPRRGPGRVHVAIEVTAERVRIRVDDDGPGLPDDFDRSETGLGIGATVARLGELFGDDHHFEISRLDPTGTRVVLELPRSTS